MLQSRRFAGAFLHLRKPSIDGSDGPAAAEVREARPLENLLERGRSLLEAAGGGCWGVGLMLRAVSFPGISALISELVLKAAEGGFKRTVWPRARGLGLMLYAVSFLCQASESEFEPEFEFLMAE